MQQCDLLSLHSHHVPSAKNHSLGRQFLNFPRDKTRGNMTISGVITGGENVHGGAIDHTVALQKQLVS